jgi:hypothetical protein
LLGAKVRRVELALGWLAIAASVIGCRRPHQVGDHVLVEWRGSDRPAVIIAVEGPARFRVHYDGYSDDWNEVVPGTRIHGRLAASMNPNLAVTKVRHRPGASASAAASAAPPVVFRVGDRVRVEWHGALYSAAILEEVGPDRFRVHYDGYGPEWDETVGLNRIQRK